MVSVKDRIWLSLLTQGTPPSPTFVPPIDKVKVQLTKLIQLQANAIPQDQWASLVDMDILMNYCVMVPLEEVPDDVLEGLILYSRIFLVWLRDSEHEKDKYDMAEQVRMKMVMYLMRDPISRFDIALREVKTQMAAHGELARLRKLPHADQPWLSHIPLWSTYCDLLVINNKFEKDTQTACERLIESINQSGNASAPMNVKYVAVAHAHLALVLERMGVDDDIQKRHTELAVRYFRKNRSDTKRDAEKFLRRPDQPGHPVFVALGEEWFSTRPSPRDDKRVGKACMWCSATELTAKLSRCARCQVVNYWYVPFHPWCIAMHNRPGLDSSRECQKSDWKVHKDMCQTFIDEKKTVADLKEVDSGAAHDASDIMKWKDGSHYANFEGLINALGIHRDPSRGKTHIVFRKLANAPKPRPKDFRARVLVTEMTVYRIDDILKDIVHYQKGSRMTAKDVREGIMQNLRTMLQELPNGDPMPGATRGRLIPIMDLTFGPGIHPAINASAVSAAQLQRIDYDPNWRKMINANHGPPPARFLVPSRSPDAELPIEELAALTITSPK
ncbi:hypothetical protein BXZ70DRAFT_1056297 [Cristinia sonorae]|uniref:Uncharacterized protein n=1 Tax=Cristinia sonorae TaxID=1940300 RepID=A0A8K0UTM6_9AGAR|nr:hypothetical protein BXZ70DRAFT_1056297 [Cristinia sonorae]